MKLPNTQIYQNVLNMENIDNNYEYAKCYQNLMNIARKRSKNYLYVYLFISIYTKIFIYKKNKKLNISGGARRVFDREHVLFREFHEVQSNFQHRGVLQGNSVN